MEIYPVNIILTINALLLGVFSLNRYKAHLENRYNKIIYKYFLASFFVSLGFFTYGISAFLTNEQGLLSFFAGLALILNAIGFNHFFQITLNDLLPPRGLVFAKYSLYIFVIFLAICMIIDPPLPIIDSINVIHWRFSPVIGIIAAAHMDIIFILNIGLLLQHFYRLRKLSIINSLALVLTFAFTGIGGSYQYAGDDPFGLFLGAIGLYIGVSILFFSVVHGITNRMLEWTPSTTYPPDPPRNPQPQNQ